MKKIILMCLIFTFLCNAQSYKKEILLDENKDTITSELFLKKIKDDVNYYYKISETDSVRTIRLISKFINGTISQIKKDSILKEINFLSNSNISNSNIIVINFFLKDSININGSCFHHYSNNSYYNRFFKKKENINVKQFFITEKDFKIKDKNIIEDKSNLIKKIIFLKPELCGNYIIIYPNNTYKLCYGEYRIDHLLRFINEYQDNE